MRGPWLLVLTLALLCRGVGPVDAATPKLDAAEARYIASIDRNRSAFLDACKKIIDQDMQNQRLDEALALRRQVDSILLGQSPSPTFPAEAAVAWSNYTAAAEQERQRLLQQYDLAIETGARRKDPHAVGAMRKLRESAAAASADAVPVAPDSFPNLIVRPFVGEQPGAAVDEVSRRAIPDELSVQTMPGRFRIEGTDMVGTAWIGGTLAGHFGKAVFVKGVSPSGVLVARKPSGFDATGYQLLVVKRGGEVTVYPLPLAVDNVAHWSVVTRGAVVSVVVRQREDKPMLELPIRKDDFECVGFAATVRYPGNSALLDVAVEKYR